MARTKSAWYGMHLMNMVASQVPAFGKIRVVFNSSDTDEGNYQYFQDLMTPDNEGAVRFYTSLSDAVAACEDNNNDVILLDSNTSHKVTEMLTVSQRKVHFIGMSGTNSRLTNQRCMISNTGAGAATDTAMIKVTGYGCTFKNIAFKNNWTVTENLYCVDVNGGDYNTFENCTFHNLGSAHLTNNAAAALALNGASDSEFINCTIGHDTSKVSSTGGQVCLIAGATDRTTFTDCMFRAYTSDTTHVFVNVTAEGSNILNLFRNCAFVNYVNQGCTLAVAMKTAAATNGDTVLDSRCFASGVTDFASNAVGNTNMMMAWVVPTAGTSGIAVKPTA